MRFFRFALTLVEDIVPSLMLAIIVVLISLDVVGRYIFSQPIAGAGTIATLLFVWVIFLGASGAVHRGLHVGFDLAMSQLPTRIRSALQLGTALLVVSVLVLVTVFGIELTLDAHSRRLLPLEVPYSWLTAAIPTGSALMAFRFMQRAVRAVRELWTGIPQNSSTADDNGPDRPSADSVQRTHAGVPC